MIVFRHGPCLNLAYTGSQGTDELQDPLRGLILPQAGLVELSMAAGADLLVLEELPDAEGAEQVVTRGDGGQVSWLITDWAGE